MVGQTPGKIKEKREPDLDLDNKEDATLPF
jgi:hypothetical protein